MTDLPMACLSIEVGPGGPDCCSHHFGWAPGRGRNRTPLTTRPRLRSEVRAHERPTIFGHGNGAFDHTNKPRKRTVLDTRDREFRYVGSNTGGTSLLRRRLLA